MRRILFSACYIFILSLVSCEKDNPVVNTGKITISTRKYLSAVYYVKGYSFENSKYVDVILLTEEADIAPVDSINLSGNAVGIKLSVLSNNPNGFYLNGKFSNEEEANTFFKNYKIADYPSSNPLTGLLEPYDIFTLKTIKNNYVKFMITDVRKISDFFEADLKYIIQKNGTNEFPE